MLSSQGQFALLATIAARAGARYVYAIEGNRAAYERALITVAEAGLSGKIGVLYGYSANVTLRELPPPPAAVFNNCNETNGSGWPGVELVVHELLGEIAGMEGAAFAIADFHRRHLGLPTGGVNDNQQQHRRRRRRRVSIPFSARSYIAPTAFPPASYWSTLEIPVIVSPGTTFLKVWDYPESALLVLTTADASTGSTQAQPS